MNDYRFLSHRPGERQEDGFFVDDQDQVLFWPDEKGPGYVLTVENALRIARPGMTKSESESHAPQIPEIVRLIVVGILFAGVFILVEPLHELAIGLFGLHLPNAPPKSVEFALIFILALLTCYTTFLISRSVLDLVLSALRGDTNTKPSINVTTSSSLASLRPRPICIRACEIRRESPAGRFNCILYWIGATLPAFLGTVFVFGFPMSKAVLAHSVIGVMLGSFWILNSALAAWYLLRRQGVPLKSIPVLEPIRYNEALENLRGNEAQSI